MSKPISLPPVAPSAMSRESQIEKTSRAAKEIIDDENEKRDAKIKRLRDSRLQWAASEGKSGAVREVATKSSRTGRSDSKSGR